MHFLKLIGTQNENEFTSEHKIIDDADECMFIFLSKTIHNKSSILPLCFVPAHKVFVFFLPVAG